MAYHQISSGFPLNLLQAGIKFTSEPPQGVRTCTFVYMPHNILDYSAAPPWPVLLYTLAILIEGLLLLIGLRLNMLKALEQLNSVPRVVLENINDKLIRDGSQCGSYSLANSSTGGAGSGSSMQRYVIKKTSDPSTSASLNLTLVGTGKIMVLFCFLMYTNNLYMIGQPAPVKRKASLEQALSDADGAYQRTKKNKKGERTQSSGGQVPAKSKANQTEKVKLDKQKGSDSETKSSKGEKSVRRKKRASITILDHAELPVSAADSDMDSQPLIPTNDKNQETKARKVQKKRNSILSNPEKAKEGKSPAKSAEQASLFL
jgi:hypothetical protein